MPYNGRRGVCKKPFVHKPLLFFIIPPEPGAGNFLQILMVYFSRLVSVKSQAHRLKGLFSGGVRFGIGNPFFVYPDGLGILNLIEFAYFCLGPY